MLSSNGHDGCYLSTIIIYKYYINPTIPDDFHGVEFWADSGDKCPSRV